MEDVGQGIWYMAMGKFYLVTFLVDTGPHYADDCVCKMHNMSTGILVVIHETLDYHNIGVIIIIIVANVNIFK